MEATPRRFRRRALAVAALLLLVASLGTGVTSLALFTDQQDVTNNGFTTGTIIIDVAPTTAIFNVSLMMPGDDTTTSVTVTNNGLSQLKWSVTSIGATGTGGLEDEIDLDIGQMSAVACSTWAGNSALATGSLSSVSLSDRVLNAGASAVMCFRASLPLSTGNAFQGKTASTTFRFDAEQTANN